MPTSGQHALRRSVQRLPIRGWQALASGEECSRRSRTTPASRNAAARKAGIQIFVVPHRRWEPGDFENWDHPRPYQMAPRKMQTFARGSWGEWHPDLTPQPSALIVKDTRLPCRNERRPDLRKFTVIF